MIYRIYPTKDTFITNTIVNGVQQTGSNAGASETLSVFKKAGISGTIGVNATASISHALLEFDLSSLSSVTGSAQTISYHLVMKDAQTCSTLPYSYDMEVAPVTTDWDEGRGIDADYFSDPGFANWIKPKQQSYWTTPGGDVRSPYTSFHFDQGNEDLDVDITSVVNSWLSGTFPNYGLMVRVSSSLESDPYDYYIKKFFGKTTNFMDRRPYIEARWDDSVKDDRNNFSFDYPSNLFLYNVVRGNPTDLPSHDVYVNLNDASGTLMTVTGSRVSTGIYSASFTLPTGSYSGSVFSDVWFSGSRAYMTGTINPLPASEQEVMRPKSYFVSAGDLKQQYSLNEYIRVDLYISSDLYAPSVVSSASLDYRGEVVTKAYYQIKNDRTEEIVVPFGTGSVETTRLSYDDEGNYFNFYMGSLSPGNVYRLVFLFDVDGQKRMIDRQLKFRVVQ